jgi:LPXTG-motif cell wall-anchored protein
VVLVAAIFACHTAFAAAQQSGTSSETKAFEVIAVDGSQLVVKLPEGTRQIDVPADFRFNIDGRAMSVQELKPGMKGTATITTRTTVTPVTVTEVKNGTVVQSTGGTIIVRTAEGVKMFTQGDIDKRNIKIVREGKPALVSDFRAGDNLSATIVTAKPPQVMTERDVQARLAQAAPAANAAPTTASAAPAGGTPRAAQPAVTTATSAPAQSAANAPRQLPATASSLPALRWAGLASLLLAAGLMLRRRESQH